SDRSLELRNSSATQFLEAVRPVLPLPPKIHTQSSADPRSQVSEHARGLTEAKVAAPSNQVWSQLFNDLWQRFPQRPASHVPDPRLECGEGLRRNAPLAPVIRDAASRPVEFHHQPLSGRVEDWRAGLGRCLCSPLPRPFGCEVSQHLDRAMFPVPATSNAACGFPALRSPVCFVSRVMGPILLGRLSAGGTELDSR